MKPRQKYALDHGECILRLPNKRLFDDHVNTAVKLIRATSSKGSTSPDVLPPVQGLGGAQ